MGNWWKVGAAVVAAAAYVIWDGRRVSARRRNAQLARGKRFVIVGGGFAGVEAARELVRLLPETGSDDAEVILIDQHDYLLFTPMLTEAVGASIEPHHIIVPYRSFSPRIQAVRGAVGGIDLHRRTVTFANDHLDPITGDYLLLALGASSNFHGIPGVEDASFTLKSLDDAYGIRENAMEMVKAAAEETDAAKRQANLTFVVAGGGYTGVEGIAALNELVQESVAQHPALEGTRVNMLIVEPMKRLMSEVTPDLASYAQKQLEAAGIRVLLQVGIKGVDGNEVELANGERLRAQTLIWTAGVQANPLMPQLGAKTGKSKGVRVTGSLEVPGFDRVWAVGDCAEIPKADGQGTYAATAQNASREGKLAAQNMIRHLRGEAPEDFTYTPIGELALVGKRRGVARVYGMNFSGFLAYAMWRAVYIMKMPSMAQRFRVLGDWTLDFLLGPVAQYHVASAHSKKDLAEAQR